MSGIRLAAATLALLLLAGGCSLSGRTDSTRENDISPEVAVADAPAGPVALPGGPSVSVEHPLILANVEGEAFARIRYACGRSMTFDLVVYTRSPQEVRTLFTEKPHEPGEYETIWDGNDEFGTPVGNGYYFLKAVDSSSGSVLFDAADTPWGTPIDPAEVVFRDDGSFSYHVRHNALIRAGAADSKSGVYYRTLLDWAPRPSGHHYEQWSGYDTQGKVPLLGRLDMTMHMRAYRLPESTIFGNRLAV